MIRPILVNVFALACIVACAVPVQAITCDECREIGTQKDSIEQDLALREQEIKTAFEQKKYHVVAEINKQITDLRRNLIDLQKKEAGCKDACKPELIKENECNRLRSEILKLEETSTDQGDVEPLDKLYRELAKCHKDLAQMTKTP